MDLIVNRMLPEHNTEAGTARRVIEGNRTRILRSTI